MPKLVAHYAQRRSVRDPGNIDVERDLSDVRMLADGYVRLLAADATGTVVNFCSGKRRSLRSVLGELKAITGHEAEIRFAAHPVRHVAMNGSDRCLSR